MTEETEREAASRSPLTLDWLLSPFDLDEFTGEVWERQHLLVRRMDPRYYRDLLSLSDLDEILSTMSVKSANLRIVDHGREIPASATISAEPGGPQNALEKLYELYRTGSTIVFNSLHERWPPLTRLCRSVAREISGSAQVNVYLTPAGGQGFKAHYDSHDVFVAQAHGSKRWRVYPPPIELPSHDQPYRLSGLTAPAEPIEEFDLRAGDLLYLPRGYMHEAEANDEASVHLTIGVMPVLWSSVLINAVRTIVKADARFRRALPLRFDSDPRRRQQAEAAGALLLQVLSESLSPEQMIADGAMWARRSGTASLNGHLRDLEAVRSLGPASRTGRRPGLRWQTIEQDDAISLEFHGKAVRFPRHVANEVRFVARTDSFTLDDIPGELDDAGRRALVGTLVREGFLTMS